jgi:hypothetical protein
MITEISGAAMGAPELATTGRGTLATRGASPRRRDRFADLDVGIRMMARGARSYGGFAPAEWVLVLVLAAWSVVPIVHLVANLHGGFLTGADGPFPADQLQYLAWIRDSGAHVLAGDLFEIPPGERVFLHPMWVISGGLWRGGLPIWLGGFIWKPVAVLVAILGVRAYVGRLVEGGAWHRTAIVALALCYVSPLVILDPAAARLAGEMFTAGQLWGYLPSVIAVGLMPVYLLALERAVRDGRALPCGPLVVAGSIGLLVGWLHPWEGETLALVTLGLLCWMRGEAAVKLLVCLGSVALPLAGYFALAHADAAWRIAEAGGNVSRPPFTEFLAAVGPLLAVAIAGVRRPGPELQERALLLWPVASLLSYFVLAPSSSAGHALAGLAIPLAVLADSGVRRALHASSLHQAHRASMRLAAIGAVVIVLIVPGAIHVARSLLRTIGNGRSGQIMSQSDRAALRYLARRQGTGGVLAAEPLSTFVPAFSGKPTWVGHPLWTPDFSQRAATAQAIVEGRLPGAVTRRSLLLSGATYVLAGCGSPNLGRLLTPILRGSIRFGCDQVYVVR